MTPPAQCRTDIGITVPAGTQGRGGGNSAHSRRALRPVPLPHHGSQPVRATLAEHIGDIVAAGLAFGDGPASSSITA